MTINERLDSWIKEKKYTKRYVANAIGMSEQGLGQFLKGISKSISSEYLEKLHTELDVSVDWLISGHTEVSTYTSSRYTQEHELLEYFERLDSEHKKDLIVIASAFCAEK